MEEKIRLELFTIAEVRNWLVHNQSVRGISEEIISRTRAWAIVYSPYAKDDMYIISALFVNDEIAAYTAVFPEQMVRPDKLIYWDTTLYVAPKYEGRGYAAIVIGNICEQYGDAYFDHAAAEASVQNFKFLGLPVCCVPQYIFRPKALRGFGIKTIMAFTAQKLRDIKRHFVIQKHLRVISNMEYALRYVDFIDDETYEFIQKNSENDVFLRTQSSFNWMLKYGFSHEAPLLRRVRVVGQFNSERKIYRKYAVQVWSNRKLSGFYILVQNQKQSVVKYLYFEPSKENEVFASIFEHIYHHPTLEFVTYHPLLSEYIEKSNLYQAKTIYQTSLTIPQGYELDKTKFVQAGDGDMFS